MDTKRIRESGVGTHADGRRAADRTMASRTLPNGAAEETMATIVEYTDQKQPKNQYPQRIVSPVRSGPCCFTDMEEVGKPQEDGRWVFQYKRCKKCGFALRVILREIPDAALAAELRKILANSFVRNVPE
ncbi:MAG: hypothetical protein EHM71_03100 [Zetaproteobacteria bacterium]|nr:MAG: hypothetical protein EHM71_03100 [Zetaproteobacteria bacterium]